MDLPKLIMMPVLHLESRIWTNSVVLWIHTLINTGMTAVLMTENHSLHHNAVEYVGELQSVSTRHS
jgi:hypothetical protein